MKMTDEQILHDPLHLAEPLTEADWRPREGLDEASLVLLPEQPQYEALLAAVYDPMSSEDQEACDEVGGDPVHQEVDHQDPGGDEEHSTVEVHRLSLCCAHIRGHSLG